MKSVINNDKSNTLKSYQQTEETSSDEFAVREKEVHYFDEDLTEEEANKAFLHMSQINSAEIFEKYL